MNASLLFNCAFLVFLCESLVGAQHVITVTHVEVITVTWDASVAAAAAAASAEQVDANYSTESVEAANYQEGDSSNGNLNSLDESMNADGEYHINAESELATGRVHAHQTKTNLSSFSSSSSTTASTTNTTQSQGNSAASLKVSLAVGLVAFLAMAAAA